MPLLVDSVVEIAFKYYKSPLETVESKREVIESLRVAKTKGRNLKYIQRRFYIGTMAGFLYPEATIIAKTRPDEIKRVLDLKNYKEGAGDGYRTFEQQRAFNAMRKAWERLAEAAGIARLDNRGGARSPYRITSRGKIPSIDLPKVQKAIEGALVQVAEEFGVEITIGDGSFDSNHYAAKYECTILNQRGQL
jgi:hypothetical protein